MLFHSVPYLSTCYINVMRKMYLLYKVVPPPVISWFISPLTIDISPTKTIVKLELCEPQLSVLERGHHLVYRSPTCVHHLVQMVDVVQMVSFIGELTIKPINYRYITYISPINHSYWWFSSERLFLYSNHFKRQVSPAEPRSRLRRDGTARKIKIRRDDSSSMTSRDSSG